MKYLYLLIFTALISVGACETTQKRSYLNPNPMLIDQSQSVGALSDDIIKGPSIYRSANFISADHRSMCSDGASSASIEVTIERTGQDGSSLAVTAIRSDKLSAADEELNKINHNLLGIEAIGNVNIRCDALKGASRILLQMQVAPQPKTQRYEFKTVSIVVNLVQ